ncbi:MAG: hypothetical protein ACTHMS_02235 [Jatrophihabitans sp.]|uniref:hypothetical protein n=1 Tax=Jatrophihabitans sp. TaxID=1932789 RepID=UPI003F80A580
MTDTTYCTILARNYLPKALALADSLRRHGAQRPLVVFLIDATADTVLPDLPGVRWMHPGHLPLSEREVLDLAMAYDLVEFATAVKPLVLQLLLTETEYAVYLDPDTYVVSPMDELEPALAASGGLLLTPHYLQPTPETGRFTEGHLLHVGVYNLGFCGVTREAKDFLAWWWAHLRTECLHDVVGGLFVDQKWVDVGAVLFPSAPLRHYGYNVGMGNLHERHLVRDGDGYRIVESGEPLRLYHFHAFDPRRPEELSTRLDTGTADLLQGQDDLLHLCREYAEVVLAQEAIIGPQPPYRYGTDQRERRVTRRMRHAHRVAVRSGEHVPSPFVLTEADAYEDWRRSSRKLVARLMFSDLAKGVRAALPEEYDDLKKKLPGLTTRLRGRYLERSGMWG